MQHEEIITQLSHIADNPSEVVYAITMQNILTAIVQRMGEGALTLSVNDLYLVRDEVKISISRNLDERDYIDMVSMPGKLSATCSPSTDMSYPPKPRKGFLFHQPKERRIHALDIRNLIVAGTILFQLGALSILVNLLLPAFKTVLVIIVLIAGVLIWRRRRNN